MDFKEFIENISFDRLEQSIQFMGVGMIGVFLIIGIIIGATYAINYFSNKFSK